MTRRGHASHARRVAPSPKASGGIDDVCMKVRYKSSCRLAFTLFSPLCPPSPPPPSPLPPFPPPSGRLEIPTVDGAVAWVSYAGTDYMCTTKSFCWNESPMCYHPNSKANTAYLRARGIPILAYVDDAWYWNFPPTFGCSDKVQWLSTMEAFHVGIPVSYFKASFCRTPSAT